MDLLPPATKIITTWGCIQKGFYHLTFWRTSNRRTLEADYVQRLGGLFSTWTGKQNGRSLNGRDDDSPVLPDNLNKKTTGSSFCAVSILSESISSRSLWLASEEPSTIRVREWLLRNACKSFLVKKIMANLPDMTSRLPGKRCHFSLFFYRKCESFKWIMGCWRFFYCWVGWSVFRELDWDYSKSHVRHVWFGMFEEAPDWRHIWFLYVLKLCIREEHLKTAAILFHDFCTLLLEELWNSAWLVLIFLQANFHALRSFNIRSYLQVPSGNLT